MIDLPEHLTLSIQHNDHKSYYLSIEKYFEDHPQLQKIDVDIKKRCIENNSIWEIQWYPKTPISFYYVCAPTLEEALRLVKEIK